MKTTMLFLCLFFFSCGYFEDDGYLFEKKIVGKIILSHEKHAERPNLTFKYSEQSRIEIIGNCKSITYDTINHRFFVEKFLNPHNSSYYQISVLDTNTVSSSKAYKEYKLEGERFNYLVNKCKTCKVIDLTGK